MKVKYGIQTDLTSVSGVLNNIMPTTKEDFKKCPNMFRPQTCKKCLPISTHIHKCTKVNKCAHKPAGAQLSPQTYRHVSNYANRCSECSDNHDFEVPALQLKIVSSQLEHGQQNDRVKETFLECPKNTCLEHSTSKQVHW